MARETHTPRESAGDPGPDTNWDQDQYPADIKNDADKEWIITTESRQGDGPSSRDDEPPSEKPVVSPGTDGDPSQAVPPPYSSFTSGQKRMIVLAAALASFFSPLTGQIYFPALNVIAKEFDVTASQVNLTVSTYMIFQGIAPMFIGGFADSAGRRPAFVLCFVIYILANEGVAVCTKYSELLVLRCFQSAGIAATIALSQAVIADTITSAERGNYIGITVLPIVLAPSLGPVLGGVLAQYLGWRSIFWFLTILAAVTLILMVFFFPETCRKLVGDGSIRPHPVYRTLWQVITDSRQKRQAERAGDHEALRRIREATSRKDRPKLRIGFGNPLDSLKMLFEPLLGVLLGYSAIVFAGFYAIATVMPSQFQRLYGFDDVKVGLMYLPMAGGSAVAAFVTGPAIDWNYRRHARKHGIALTKGAQDDLSNFPLERARIEIGLPLLALATAVVFAWGWALQYQAPIAVPCVLLFLMGVGMIGYMNSSTVLVVDMYPKKAGAATAANNLTRCLLGAAATGAVSPMVEAMGVGWTFTVFGFLYLAGAPLLLLIMRNGIEWRRKIRAKEERKRVKAEERERERSNQATGQGANKVPSEADSAGLGVLD
ncbi:major facilitator superfamily domain-containing protein [Diaporthe sp. PMI_573]|nr:major facilitator superfamily domain-containing protein [Diaporthaceae sp. PMI_573]